MNYIDVYYRALIDYRKNTVGNRECDGQRGAVAKANAKNDSVAVMRKICTVKTDWIDTIEAALEHVDKAIREERQFIRSNGEVVDIEKVKSVSKDSVVHLAQHSNLITRYEEGQDIVPDKLYIVERLNDYAVYENRFLYMLLCYLRDFITIRYNKIVQLEHTYNGEMKMKKKIDMPKRHIVLDISLAEERADDPLLKQRSKSKDIIKRIATLLEIVHAFLATPLMQEVSKAPMLKPPITKTNVLRMNHNFRNAVALYDYLSSYEGDGYTVEEETQTIQPFRIDMADEFSEIVLLASALTYEYGMSARKMLEQSYREEEERRRRAEQDRHLEQLKALARRIKDSGESPEEYMLMLEKRNRALEIDSAELLVVKQQLAELQEELLDLSSENEALSAAIERKDKAIDNMISEHAEELARMEEAHRSEIVGLNAEHAAKTEALVAEHTAKTEALISEHSERIGEITASFEERVRNAEDTLRAKEQEHSERLAEISEEHLLEKETINLRWYEKTERLKNECSDMEGAISLLRREKDAVEKARLMSEARLNAIRVEHGLMTPSDDFTSREAFEEIEHQFEVFKGFFNKEWKKTRKRIRKEAFAAFKQAIKEGRAEEFMKEEMADGDEGASAQDTPDSELNSSLAQQTDGAAVAQSDDLVQKTTEAAATDSADGESVKIAPADTQNNSDNA